MNTRERLELANWTVAQAKKSGADEVSINVGNSRDIKVEMRDRKLQQLAESTQNYLSLFVYAAGRYSAHSTNDLRKDGLSKFVKEAVAMTKYLAEDRDRALPDPKYYENQKQIDLHIYDPAYERVTSEERVKFARDMEEAALAQSDQIISCTATFSDSFFEAVKVNSNGFEGARQGTAFAASVQATVRDGDSGRPMDWDPRVVRFHRDLPPPDVVGKSAVERALRKIGQTKLDSGLYDMVIENRAANRLLAALYKPMVASSLHRKSSFLEGKLGEKIGSDKLTWIDDPFVDAGLGSRLFDGEGMTTKVRKIIDKGVLKSYYVNCYYSRKLGIEPTIGSRTNVVFDYGTKSANELVKQMTKGIFVTGFLGGNSNSTTGDYSFGISGMYVEDGLIVKPVYEMNISGNLAELWHKLADVGNDPYVYSSWRRPSMYFKDIQFSGV